MKISEDKLTQLCKKASLAVEDAYGSFAEEPKEYIERIVNELMEGLKLTPADGKRVATYLDTAAWDTYDMLHEQDHGA